MCTRLLSANLDFDPELQHATLEYFTLTVFFSVFVERCFRVWLGVSNVTCGSQFFDENTRFSWSRHVFFWTPRKLSCPWYRCCLVDSGGNLLNTWL